MPNLDLNDALDDLQEVLIYRRTSKSASSHKSVEIEGPPMRFMALVEPLPQKRLMIKPEGQRTWDWKTLMTKQDLDLDWIVQSALGARKFRVMSKSEWKGTAGGHFEYEIAENPDTVTL